MLNDELIYAVLCAVAEIPCGRVASYGQIARLIGRDKNARLVGRVLRYANLYGSYPCHRVVNHTGRTAPGWPAQRRLLEAELAVAPDDAYLHYQLGKEAVSDEDWVAATTSFATALYSAEPDAPWRHSAIGAP